MATWLNRNTGVGVRNGTTTHTIGHSTAATSPSSGCALNFVPAAGNLLVVVVAGAITHTSSGAGAGSGWTERQQPVSSAELSLFTKTAVGNDFLTLTHNGSNWPMAWVVYEFAAGSSYTNSASESANDDTFPVLSGLPSSAKFILAAFANTIRAAGAVTTGSTVSSPWVEDFESASADDGVTDGIYLYVFHQEDFTGTSVTPVFTKVLSGGNPSADRQKIVAAFSISTAVETGSASGSYAWAGTASGQAPGGPPQGSASGAYGWAGTASGQAPIAFGANIAAENALPGDPSGWAITGVGDTANLGFARQYSVNIGDTIEFCCDGTGTVLDIYRIGWYGGDGWRRITTLANTATDQPNPATITASNGGNTCSGWGVTATWNVPANAISGFFVGVYRNTAQTNASYIPFVIRDDTHNAGLVYKTADTTWGIAYNHYGTPASPLAGRTFYGPGAGFDIVNRAHAVSYHRPVVSRAGHVSTYWLACEAPMIRFLERNGIDVKYIGSRDLHDGLTGITGSSVLMSCGHDEYWSQGMRNNAALFRDAGGHLIFASGNEVFWRIRFVDAGGDRQVWCYKDTMPGPGTHIAGQPLDPVSWTGTFRDTRRPGGADPENLLTGTFFRMNGIADRSVTINSATYGAHPFWRDTSVETTNLTTGAGIVGFEADEVEATQPTASRALLAAAIINIDGLYADDNGQNYTGNGNLNPWGIIAQRYASGAVVVGFGTCQWSWGLDATHDRGGNVVSAALQQATLNLLADLGAEPATTIPGLTTPTPVSLDVYGQIPGGPSQGSSSGSYAWAGTASGEAPGSTWLNRNTGVGVRNGTTTHTIGHSTAATSPSSGCALNFVPAAGNLLVVVVAGAITHTSSGAGAGSGWTERQQPVSSAELSLFTKTAVGNDFLTLTHNGSNWPMAWVVYEFAAGSSYTNSASESANDDTFPVLSGLPSSAKFILAAFANTIRAAGAVTTGSTVSSPWVEDFESATADDGVTDGIYLYVFHQEDFTGTSVTPVFTKVLSGGNPSADRQKIVAAFSISA